MAKKNTLRLDLSGFKELMTKLDSLGGDMKAVTEDALGQAAETIEWDTVDAVKESNLPAKGKYSKGDTLKSIVRNSQVEWVGMTGSISVGFDYSKPGAGGLLISGTPKMKPDQTLKTMYKGKKYMQEIQNDMNEIINEEIIKRMEGG